MFAKVIDDEEEEDMFADLEDEDIEDEDIEDEEDLFEDLEEDDLEEEDVAEEIEEEPVSKGGFNFGIILLVLGLVGMIAVIAIKFTSTGETDEFMGIINPKGTYGEYFLSGVIGGLVLFVIGLVATMKGKSKSTPLILEEESEIFEDDNIFEDEEEFKDEEVEEEEEGICPTCGAIIQVSCTECPECGEELAPPEEDIEEEIEEEEDILALTIECPICGAELPEDAKECTECGEPIEVSEDEEEEEDDLFADLEDL